MGKRLGGAGPAAHARATADFWQDVDDGMDQYIPRLDVLRRELGDEKFREFKAANRGRLAIAAAEMIAALCDGDYQTIAANQQFDGSEL